MAEKHRPKVLGQEHMLDAKDIERQLDMIDQRLDNIDSVVSAVVERVMNQPLIINVTCPHCGKTVDIAVMGSMKPAK
ncbi:MAG: hypothetical protein PHI12_02755 [Dehalococcoidales bacterium]|nr:hypothetical protein [Dehalococcoidales bacterium]